MEAHKGVRAEGLVKRYGDMLALDGVGVDIPPGSLVAVTGFNGAGKTTLLRICATLLRPDEGSAWVNGANVVTEEQEVRRSIGVALVNERAVYWRLTGLQNLVFFGRTSGLSKKEATLRAERWVKEVGLAHVANRRVSGWSAGQRQRLVLARAFLHTPPVLLIDEPMRGLDDEGLEIVRGLLRGYADSGAAVLVVGPTIEDFKDLCDEVVEFQHGREVGRTSLRQAATAGSGATS